MPYQAPNLPNFWQLYAVLIEKGPFVMKTHTTILLLCLLIGLISCREPMPEPMEEPDPIEEEEKEEEEEEEEEIVEKLPFEDKWPSIITAQGTNLILWVEDCVWEYDPSSKQSTKLYCPDGIVLDRSYDGDKYLYFSIGDRGLSRLDLTNADVQQLNSSNSCLPTDLIPAIAAEKNGFLWCAAGTIVSGNPVDYTVGSGLIQLEWETQNCQQWDTTNSNIPFQTIMSMDVADAKVYFSNVAKFLSVYDYEIEYLVQFDGSQFIILDSADIAAPLLRGIEAISDHELIYEKYQDKDIVTDSYEAFVWDALANSASKISINSLGAVNVYLDSQRNEYMHGFTKYVNNYNMVETIPFLIYNGAGRSFNGIERLNSLYRFGMEDSIWVGSKSLYHLPIL